MSTEFNFLVIDANQPVETQQGIVRELVSAASLDLAKFQRRSAAAAASARATAQRALRSERRAVE